MIDAEKVNKMIEELKKLTEVSVDKRIEATDLFFKVQGEIEEAFELLNELPDSIEEDVSYMEEKVQAEDKRRD